MVWRPPRHRRRSVLYVSFLDLLGSTRRHLIFFFVNFLIDR